jgi:hypothetical protein
MNGPEQPIGRRRRVSLATRAAECNEREIVVRRELAYQAMDADPIATDDGIGVTRSKDEHATPRRRGGVRSFGRRRRIGADGQCMAMPLRLSGLEHDKPTCETFDGSSSPSRMASADLHETPPVLSTEPLANQVTPHLEQRSFAKDPVLEKGPNLQISFNKRRG